MIRQSDRERGPLAPGLILERPEDRLKIDGDPPSQQHKR
jgi:hypothetical protein